MADKPLTFEQAMARLEEIVTGIEQGRIGLEESIERFAEGMALVRRCRTILSEAEMKIQRLQAEADGGLTAEDMPPESGEDSVA